MRFTLFYSGKLPPNGKSKEKWRIRRCIEPQLRRLWDARPFKDIAKYIDPHYDPDNCYVGKRVGKFEFIPCISTTLNMRTELQIRILSSQNPGDLLRGSDIDNRLKTLLDALSIPSEQQIPDDANAETDGRVFCLLEDDKLVTRIDVSNDRLLSVADNSMDMIVLVDVHPVAFSVTMANIGISV